MNINLTLIGQMITFLVFVAFTMKYVWPPITKALRERQKRIAEGLAAADRGKHELELAQHKSARCYTLCGGLRYIPREKGRLENGGLEERFVLLGLLNLVRLQHLCQKYRPAFSQQSIVFLSDSNTVTITTLPCITRSALFCAPPKYSFNK